MSIRQGLKRDMVRLLPPLVFAAIAAVYLGQSGGFSDPTSAQAPLLYGRLLLGLSGVVFVLALARALRDKARDASAEEEPHWMRAGLIFAAIALFIATIFAVGFYGAVPLFLFLFFIGPARLPLWKALLGAGLALTFIWLVFGRFLHMNVFAGYLF